MENVTRRIELDYVRDVGSLPVDSLIQFYEILAHNLTVSVRAIWSDEALTDFERVQQMKWLNEIMHRVVLKSAALRTNRNRMSETDTWRMIEEYIAECPQLAVHISFASISSFQAVSNLRRAV